MSRTAPKGPDRRGRLAALEGVGRYLPLPAFHVLTVALVALAGVSWESIWVCAGSYTLVTFGVTAGFHRYFSHRAFRTGGACQLGLAILGTLALQKGVLWWAATHRRHHRETDRDGDPHSPVRRGLWWAHMGWISSPESKEVDPGTVKDLACSPELRWLDRHWALPFLLLCLVTLLAGGLQAMVWGCFVSTLLVWHASFSVNSLAHMVGRRVYDTPDASRNLWPLALITHGEGWHNNHHFYPASVRQGFRWYELDLSYAALWAMERAGLVWDLRRPPGDVVAGWLGGKDHSLGPGSSHVAAVGRGSSSRQRRSRGRSPASTQPG